MKRFFYEETSAGISPETQRAAMEELLRERAPKRVLLIPPDFTRYHSGAGFLTVCCYEYLSGRAEVDILPALGTHAPMSAQELDAMYPGIPHERFLVHHWRSDVETLGEFSVEELSELSDGLWQESIAIEVNRLLRHGGYDLILSIGQVVPHEVIGMSNHAKNIFVGVGGSEMINSSHMLGAVCGLERMMGHDHTPVRELFDRALTRTLGDAPLVFVLTTMSAGQRMHGLFLGDERAVLDAAVASSQQHNIFMLDRPIQKCVVKLDPAEYKSTWLGNKAVYRSRMAIADGGELLILAPGVEKFGEDSENDRIIRRYGYRGRLHTLALFQKEENLRRNMGAAAHLIHGSSDGRFSVSYAVERISQEEISSVGYRALSYRDAAARYCPETLSPGWNMLPDGEEIFYIDNPALGLWAEKKRFLQEDTL